MSKNLTPEHLRCDVGASCPSIHRLGDGRLLIVGSQEYLGGPWPAGKVSDDESWVVISPDLLADYVAEKVAAVSTDRDRLANTFIEIQRAEHREMADLRSQLETLKEALKPFAEGADTVEKVYSTAAHMLTDDLMTGYWPMTLGGLRRARAAIKATENADLPQGEAHFSDPKPLG